LARFQGFAQELQAEINSELLETLNECELHDWNRHGKVRDAWEKWLRDPDDVFIHAENRRRELLRQGKKPPERRAAIRRRRPSKPNKGTIRT